MKTRQQMYEQLMSRASEDVDFRAALLSDPKNALSDELDVSIPDHIEINVHESDLNTVHLSLPPRPRLLDEGQLNSTTAGYDTCKCDDGGCEGSSI